MDSIFLLTVGFIFLGALLSNIMKWSNKDRVLKDLHNFHSTIEMQNGKEIWGKTHIYANGIELFFSRAAKNSMGDPINSFIFYRNDIDNIRTIYRNHGELTVENQELRTREVKQVSNPNIVSKISRKIRIFFNIFNDAIGEALNVFLSRMKSNQVISTQSDYIKKMGTTALSSSGNDHDPILESYINRRISVIVKEDNVKEDDVKEDENESEYCGFLKEYSSAWLSVLDCKVTHTHEIDLDDLSRLALQRDLDFIYTLRADKGGTFALDVTVHYFGDEPLKLIKVKGGDDDKNVSEQTRNYKHRLNKNMKQGDTLSFTLKALPPETLTDLDKNILPLSFEMIAEARRETDLPEDYFKHQKFLPEIKLEIQSTHIADVYLPRTIATLRHGAV